MTISILIGALLKKHRRAYIRGSSSKEHRRAYTQGEHRRRSINGNEHIVSRDEHYNIKWMLELR